MLAPLASLQTPSAPNPSQAPGSVQTVSSASARSARRFHAARIGVRLADARPVTVGARLSSPLQYHGVQSGWFAASVWACSVWFAASDFRATAGSPSSPSVALASGYATLRPTLRRQTVPPALGAVPSSPPPLSAPEHARTTSALGALLALWLPIAL